MSDSFLPTSLHSSPSSTLHNVLSSSSPVSSHSIMPVSPLSSSLSSHSSFTSPSKVSSNPATGSLVMNFSPPTSTLSHSCPNPPHSPRSPQRIKLTNTDIETLFANIRELYALNSDLLKELIATCKLPRHQRNVGKCFLQRVYSAFPLIHSLINAISLLGKLIHTFFPFGIIDRKNRAAVWKILC